MITPFSNTLLNHNKQTDKQTNKHRTQSCNTDKICNGIGQSAFCHSKSRAFVHMVIYSIPPGLNSNPNALHRMHSFTPCKCKYKFLQQLFFHSPCLAHTHTHTHTHRAWSAASLASSDVISQYRCKKRLDKDLEEMCDGPLKGNIQSVRTTYSDSHRMYYSDFVIFSTVCYMFQLHFDHLQALLII